MAVFRVNVSKDYLGFAAAHFITFKGHLCESLHGHNYRIAVTVEGSVDAECHFVVDFSILKRFVRELADQLDHRVLLPANNPKLRFEEDGAAVLVHYLGELAYRFPRRDCAMIPIANTTAEMIAEWFAAQLQQRFRDAQIDYDVLEVEVEESPGQSAFYRDGRSRENQ